MNDTISREAVADAINGIECTRHTTWYEFYQKVMTAVEKLPPAEPKIIYCKDCAKHNRRIGDFKELPNGETIWYWKHSACPLAEFRGKAQGHEYDYQFCCYAERRTE